MAANDGSRGLAYLSTASYADRLIFCVRYGYRSFPVAVAAMDLNEREMKKRMREEQEQERITTY